MTLDNPSALPPRARPNTSKAGTAPALDGEVIPPRVRILHPEPGPAPAAATRSTFRMRLSTALLASGLVLTAGAGGAFEAYRWTAWRTQRVATPDPTAVALARLGRDLADLKASVASSRQDETVRSVRANVDLLKREVDGLRGDSASAIAQITAKLDKPVASTGPNTADILARLDKLDHDSRLGDIAARLDRIEHQVSSPTPTGSIPSAGKPPVPQSIVPQTSANVPASKPVKAAVLDNWIVRDVYSGIALVEGRSGSVREVVPGEVLPGAGEVRSIERRGRAWIVVTSRGIIDTETW